MKNEFGTLQIRINLAKTADGKIRIDGPVSVYDQPAPKMEHTLPLTKNPMGTRINHGWDDVRAQITNAIKNAGFELE